MDEKFMRSYYRVYNSEDPEALAAFYHADVELRSSQGLIRGADALLDTYRELIANFHDKMIPSYIAVDGECLVVDILDRFTAKRDVAGFMGVSLGAGESFSLHLRGRYEFLDGVISRIEIEQVD